MGPVPQKHTKAGSAEERVFHARTPRHSQAGFTFVEILVAIAVLSIIAGFSIVTFRSMYRTTGERIAAQEVVDALREARNNSIAAKGDTTYGVRVGTSSVTRFVGSAYSDGNASNTVYTFEAGSYATGTLVASGSDITFARLTGMPSATGTIIITDIDNTSTTTITIEGTGLIEY